MADFAYSPMFPTTADTTEYELVSSDHVRLVEMAGETFLRVDPEGLTLLAERYAALSGGFGRWYAALLRSRIAPKPHCSTSSGCSQPSHPALSLLGHAAP